MIAAAALGGVVAVFLAWRAVARGRTSVWTATTGVAAALGVVALASGDVVLATGPSAAVSAGVGVASGAAMYAATVAFVAVASRWERFDRHVAEVYRERGRPSLPLAVLLGAGVVAPSEELFWRGLVQGGLAEGASALWGAGAAWVAYVAANAGSGSLPIVAGAVVGGALWAALALWTGGVLAGIASHVVWTALMVVLPPGSGRRGR